MDARLNFNLRSKKGKTSAIQVVVYVGGKQYRLSSGMSVSVDAWDDKKQCANVSSKFSSSMNDEHIEINQKLSDLKLCFFRNYEYICDNPKYLGEFLNIRDTMESKKNKVTATTLLEMAFEEQSKFKKITSGSMRNKKAQLDDICKYIIDRVAADENDKEKNKEDKAKNDISFFTNANVSKYELYLWEERGLNPKGIKERCKLFATLINIASSLNESLNIPMVQYLPRVEDQRSEMQKRNESLHFEIKEEEIEALNNANITTSQALKGRILFNIQLLCGQRYSDLQKVVDAVKENPTAKMVSIQTQKEGTISRIRVSKELKKWCSMVDKVISNKCYNDGIREAFKVAGCDRPIKYRNGRGEVIERPLYEAITSHSMRTTFCTQHKRKGFTEEEISLFSGNSPKVISQYYDKLTEEDGDKLALQIIENVKEDTTPSIGKECKEVLAMMGVDSAEWMEETSVENLYRMICKEESKLESMGINLPTIKGIFGAKPTTKERRNALQALKEEIMKSA